MKIRYEKMICPRCGEPMEVVCENCGFPIVGMKWLMLRGSYKGIHK